MQYVTSAPETSKVPIVPMGKMLTYSPRLTLAHNCGRRSGQLQAVCAAETAAETFKVSHRLNGKIADALASTHFCTTAADALVHYRMYVLQRTEISHCPNGKMADMPKSTLVLSDN